jgi:hypothetical protein
MSRREQFEQEYAEDHGMPIATFQQYRMGDSYRLPLIAKCWRFYCYGWNKAEESFKVAQSKPYIPVGMPKGCLACGDERGHGGLHCPKFSTFCMNERPVVGS